MFYSSIDFYKPLEWNRKLIINLFIKMKNFTKLYFELFVLTKHLAFAFYLLVFKTK